jgi:hypothetical protein
VRERSSLRLAGADELARRNFEAGLTPLQQANELIIGTSQIAARTGVTDCGEMLVCRALIHGLSLVY